MIDTALDDMSPSPVLSGDWGLKGPEIANVHRLAVERVGADANLDSHLVSLWRPSATFLGEPGPQPAERWHGANEGPVTYFTNTRGGAWAEFMRHEDSTDPEELQHVQRRVWAVDAPDEIVATALHVALPREVARGSLSSYAAELRRDGTRELIATATLDVGLRGARGFTTASKRRARAMVASWSCSMVTGRLWFSEPSSVSARRRSDN